MQKHFDFKKQAQVRFRPSFLLFCLMASGETKSLYVQPWCTWAALLPCISMSHHLLWMKKSRNLELLRALWQALSRLTAEESLYRFQNTGSNWGILCFWSLDLMGWCLEAEDNGSALPKSLGAQISATFLWKNGIFWFNTNSSLKY